MNKYKNETKEKNEDNNIVQNIKIICDEIPFSDDVEDTAKEFADINTHDRYARSPDIAAAAVRSSALYNRQPVRAESISSVAGAKTHKVFDISEEIADKFNIELLMDHEDYAAFLAKRIGREEMKVEIVNLVSDLRDRQDFYSTTPSALSAAAAAIETNVDVRTIANITSLTEDTINTHIERVEGDY